MVLGGAAWSLVRRVRASAHHSSLAARPLAASLLSFTSSQQQWRNSRTPHQDSAAPPSPWRRASAAAAQPLRSHPRGPTRRTALLERLASGDGGGDASQRDAAAAVTVHRGRHGASAPSASSITSSSTATAAVAGVSSPATPYIGPASFARAPCQAATAPHAPLDATASAELVHQQRALREAFTHARQHHNIGLAKDPRLYQEECRAFCQAHRGRSPTPHEVSRTVAVPLAPVVVLKTLAHTDRARASLHATAAAAVQLHSAVCKNELVKSSTPQLVRCLRCFHVYTARPRTLWGGEVQQSGIEHARAQASVRLRRPAPGRRAVSVGRRRRAAEDNPDCCPQCGSTRAQWMMEYVHHRTHQRA
ncbi:hypothetical protein NESM_000618400 [Novymonas esmeraldas]|uniref:Uncharacterized protein n=1 Tax=Novymonas esmeraldas TaxID=1808958 RepID=A0AAW0ERE4_9TRYP